MVMNWDSGRHGSWHCLEMLTLVKGNDLRDC